MSPIQQMSLGDTQHSAEPGILQLYDFQGQAVEGLRNSQIEGNKRIVLYAPTGAGKCHPAGTLVMGHNGELIKVEDVRSGMTLMGPDSQPRLVSSTSVGYGSIYEVSPVKGEPWHCNEEHILTLVRTGQGTNVQQRKYDKNGMVVDVSLREWMEWSKYKKHIYKLLRVGVDFTGSFPKLTVAPYLLGILLGDGALTRGGVTISVMDEEIVRYCESAAIDWGVNLNCYEYDGKCPEYSFVKKKENAVKENPLTAALRILGVMGLYSKEKYVPQQYLVSSRRERLELLAGILDTDGSLDRNGSFDYISSSEKLARDTLFLARSVGLAAYISEKFILYRGETRKYWRVSISGNIEIIPTLILRKQASERKQKKDVLRTGFSVRYIGEDDYYGFTLSGDGRYLLGDFTVTHNTEMAIYIMSRALERDSKMLFIVDRVVLVGQTSKRLMKYGIPHGIIQANNTDGVRESIRVATAQTIEARSNAYGAEFWKEMKLIVIDECHDQREKILKLAKEWGGVVIGLSATPITKGLGNFYEDIIVAETTNNLTTNKYLAPIHIHAGHEINMEGEQRVGGEWTADSVQERGRAIIGNIVETWVEKTNEAFGGPVKTLLFAASVAHAEELCRSFQQAGYDFRVSSYKDDGEATQEIVESFKNREFIGLASVVKFTKGFDDPDVFCGIDARPNSGSLSQVIQKLGRVARSAEGKEFALWLCHSGNAVGWHGEIAEIFANGVNELDDGKKRNAARREGEQRIQQACVRCGMIPDPTTAHTPGICSYCGFTWKPRRSQVRTVSGQMMELDISDSWMENQQWVWGQLCKVGDERRILKGNDEAYARRFAHAQYRALYNEPPPDDWNFTLSTENVDPRVQSRVDALLRVYKKNVKKNKKPDYAR